MTGTGKVMRFNWPKYVGVVAVLCAALIASATSVPGVLSSSLWVVGAFGLLWAVLSLAATWWIYDHRDVYSRLISGLGDVGAWATVHAGFDDATSTLVGLVGRPPAAVAAVTVRAGPSLRRARESGESHWGNSLGDIFPLAPMSLDSIFVTFAAHEVRDLGEQRAMFTELRRALRPDGRLVITEHRRDLANFAVYGPGAFHFQRAATWSQRSSEVGLSVESDMSITPFVHRTVWKP